MRTADIGRSNVKHHQKRWDSAERRPPQGGGCKKSISELLVSEFSFSGMFSDGVSIWLFLILRGMIRSFLVEWIGVVFGKAASGVRFLFPFVPVAGLFRGMRLRDLRRSAVTLHE